MGRAGQATGGAIGGQETLTIPAYERVGNQLDFLAFGTKNMYLCILTGETMGS
jgi:hypothetical protein